MMLPLDDNIASDSAIGGDRSDDVIVMGRIVFPYPAPPWLEAEVQAELHLTHGDLNGRDLSRSADVDC
jgi:hypothetical protein